MGRALDFYYDVASPYSYIAAARITDSAEAASVTVNWKPFLLGGVFRAVGNTMPAALPARGQYMRKDLIRWAEAYDIPFQFSSSFPHNSLVAMRALTATGSGQVVANSMALFRAAWAQNLNIADPTVVGRVLGDPGAQLVEATQDPEVKAQLMATTQAAIDIGAFGAPSFVVGSELFWGNDRLDMAINHAASS